MLFQTLHQGLQHIIEYVSQFIRDTLAVGPIPRHVAFIMDGNRRFAKENAISIAEGHSAGAKTLISVRHCTIRLSTGQTNREKNLDQCYDCGIQAISLYAFSLENFHRPKEQVDFLMGLLEDTLQDMEETDPLVRKHNLRIRVVGRLELLEGHVLKAIAKSMNATRNNHGRLLNICVAYTGRDEIAAAIRESVAGSSFPEKITEQSLTDNMFMGLPPLDLMIRTSGVYRLSDFMLWQCHQNTEIEVVGTNWPDFGRWEMGMVLLRWQRRRALVS